MRGIGFANVSDMIWAAGVVPVRRTTAGGVEVAVIHRPHRADWTLPKGKVDAGEVLPLTAVREMHEETGLNVELGLPLSSQRYTVNGTPKTVHYWRSNRVSGEFAVNDEVDELLWLSPDDARELLSYAHDRSLVGEAVATPTTVPLLLIRHAHAGNRETWLAAGRDDFERPLSARGLSTVPTVTALARAFGVRHVITSPAARCTETVAGLAEFATCTQNPWVHDGADMARTEFADVVAQLMSAAEPTALCTHGEQVDWLVAHFGLEPMKFSKGGVLVVHRRSDDLGLVLASEWYPPVR